MTPPLGGDPGPPPLPTEVPVTYNKMPDFYVVGTVAEWQAATNFMRNASEQAYDARGRMDAAMGSLKADWHGYAADAYQKDAQALASVAYGLGEDLEVMASALATYTEALSSAIDSYLKMYADHTDQANDAMAAAQALDRANGAINASGGHATAAQTAARNKAWTDLHNAEANANSISASASRMLDDYYAKAQTTVNTLSSTKYTFGVPSSVAQRYGASDDDPSQILTWMRQYGGTFASDNSVPGYERWWTFHHENLESGFDDLLQVTLSFVDGLALAKDLAGDALKDVAEKLGLKAVAGESEKTLQDRIAQKLTSLLDSAPQVAAGAIQQIFDSLASKEGLSTVLSSDLTKDNLVYAVNNAANSTGAPLPADVEGAMETILGGGTGAAAAFAVLSDYEKQAGEKVADALKEFISAEK